MNRNTEESFLKRINRHLPEGVDWKAGAINYLKELINQKGEGQELFHYVKPFHGGPDFSSFFDEMYSFLNILQHIDLPMQSKVLDVACGPGWTSQYLSKLGHHVFGIDISEDLIRIAEERVRSEKYSAYEDIPLNASFIVHDIENGAINEQAFDCAILESALHHFYNPINAIRNIAQSLKEEGIICIWEGVAPDKDSKYFKDNLDIMLKYETLERPYSKDELADLFKFTGFEYYEFYSQVNGLFNITHPTDSVKLAYAANNSKVLNVVIASREQSFFKKQGKSPDS